MLFSMNAQDLLGRIEYRYTRSRSASLEADSRRRIIGCKRGQYYVAVYGR